LALYGIEVHYSIKEKKYIYYNISDGDIYEKFKSEDWIEFHTYVRKDLLDMFIHFNT
jgi:hypothetical protein